MNGVPGFVDVNQFEIGLRPGHIGEGIDSAELLVISCPRLQSPLGLCTHIRLKCRFGWDEAVLAARGHPHRAGGRQFECDFRRSAAESRIHEEAPAIDSNDRRLVRQPTRCNPTLAEVDPGQDWVCREPQVSQNRAYEDGVFVTVSSAPGVEQFVSHRLEVERNRSQLAPSEVRNDLEILEADRLRMRLHELIEKIDQLCSCPLRSAVQLWNRIAQTEPLCVPAEERELCHRLASLDAVSRWAECSVEVVPSPLQHGLQQSRETGVDIVTAQRKSTVPAVQFADDHTSFAQHLHLVRTR